MAENPQLVLPCATAPHDSLEFWFLGDRIAVKAIDSVAEDSAIYANVDLSQESARQLFNWLGVQLHKGGWDNG